MLRQIFCKAVGGGNMKVGDLVRHVKTGETAILVQLWEEGHNRGVVEVIHNGQKVRWFRSSVEVVW